MQGLVQQQQAGPSKGQAPEPREHIQVWEMQKRNPSPRIVMPSSWSADQCQQEKGDITRWYVEWRNLLYTRLVLNQVQPQWLSTPMKVAQSPTPLPITSAWLAQSVSSSQVNWWWWWWNTRRYFHISAHRRWTLQDKKVSVKIDTFAGRNVRSIKSLKKLFGENGSIQNSFQSKWELQHQSAWMLSDLLQVERSQTSSTV